MQKDGRYETLKDQLLLPQKLNRKIERRESVKEKANSIIEDAILESFQATKSEREKLQQQLHLKESQNQNLLLVISNLKQEAKERNNNTAHFGREPRPLIGIQKQNSK